MISVLNDGIGEVVMGAGCSFTLETILTMFVYMSLNAKTLKCYGLKSQTSQTLSYLGCATGLQVKMLWRLKKFLEDLEHSVFLAGQRVNAKIILMG